MNRQSKDIKKSETIFIIMLAVLFAVIILVSRFVFGVDLKSMEFSLMHPGTQEILGDGIWAVSLTNYSGEISHEINMSEENAHRVRIRCGTGTGSMKFSLDGMSDEMDCSADAAHDFENLTNIVDIHITADNVAGGTFSAIWD